MKIVLSLFLLIISVGTAAQTVSLRHSYYTNIYDTVKKGPVYTVYMLTRNHLKKVCKRRSAFYTDPLVDAKCQAENSSYPKDTIYDRGHLSPAADFTFDSIAYHECMYYTNTAPQLSYFNRHLWLAIEKAVRDTCGLYDSVKVYTGCLYGSKQLNGIAIPTHYWKVIVYDHGKRTGWMSENARPVGNKATSALYDVEAIEQKVHLLLE